MPRQSFRRPPVVLTPSERNGLELQRAWGLGFRFDRDGRMIAPPGWRLRGGEWVYDPATAKTASSEHPVARLPL